MQITRDILQMRKNLKISYLSQIQLKIVDAAHCNHQRKHGWIHEIGLELLFKTNQMFKISGSHQYLLQPFATVRF